MRGIPSMTGGKKKNIYVSLKPQPGSGLHSHLREGLVCVFVCVCGVVCVCWGTMRHVHGFNPQSKVTTCLQSIIMMVFQTTHCGPTTRFLFVHIPLEKCNSHQRT